MRVDDFAAFIVARDQVRKAKEAGLPKPWTVDPILQAYRFCNVRREDDRVTVWIAENWREPYLGNQDLWFAMVVARLFNQPSVLFDIEFPVPWRPAFVGRKLAKRKALGKKLFNAAYIVSTNGRAMDKVEYVTKHILDPLWAVRKRVRAGIAGRTLAEAHETLMSHQGLGSFMAAQIVADVKYTPALKDAPDWTTWAASGPGSRRGLNRVMDRDKDAPWREAVWLDTLTRLREATLRKLPKPLNRIHAQDIQNCLCEFDKYERIRTGEGKPKQLYPGRE